MRRNSTRVERKSARTHRTSTGAHRKSATVHWSSMRFEGLVVLACGRPQAHRSRRDLGCDLLHASRSHLHPRRSCVSASSSSVNAIQSSPNAIQSSVNTIQWSLDPNRSGLDMLGKPTGSPFGEPVVFSTPHNGIQSRHHALRRFHNAPRFRDSVTR